MTIRNKMRLLPMGMLTAMLLLVGASATQAQMPQQGGMECPMMGRMSGGMGIMMGRGMGHNSMGMMGGGMGHRNRMGAMGGGMSMMGHMESMRDGMGRMGRRNQMGGMADMGTIHSLFAQSGTIRRTVKILPDGIEAVTESSDPATVEMLQAHVASMKLRLEQNQPIRQGDPLFAALFQNADKIQISITPTARGVKVTETSEDAYTVKLLQSHARAVSDFIKKGMAGMHTLHPAPPHQ